MNKYSISFLRQGSLGLCSGSLSPDNLFSASNRFYRSSAVFNMSLVPKTCRSSISEVSSRLRSFRLPFQIRELNSTPFYYDELPPEVKNEIMMTSRIPQTGVSLRHILDFGRQQPMERQLLLSARFLHRELPIRLSHRIAELDALPEGLSNLPQIKRTKSWYAESFVAFKRFPEVRDPHDVRELTSLLRNAVRRHSKVVPVVAKGVQIYKSQRLLEKEQANRRLALTSLESNAVIAPALEDAVEDPEEEVLQHFLDSFFLSRIALRFLAGHHIASYDTVLHHKNYDYLAGVFRRQQEELSSLRAKAGVGGGGGGGGVGGIDGTSAAMSLAIPEEELVYVLTDDRGGHHGAAPPTYRRGKNVVPPPPRDRIGLVNTVLSPVKVAAAAAEEARAVCLAAYGSAPDVEIYGPPALRMAYVQGHLHHCVFELVKNSLRAVQERFQGDDLPPPPVKVIVAEGMEDVTIKVSDQGAGISRSEIRKIWTYLYTTADSPLPDMDEDTNEVPTVLAGYGCGLPLSRLYARYFGGDLQIISMDGYGTDAYLHLNRLGTAEEPLPGRV